MTPYFLESSFLPVRLVLILSCARRLESLLMVTCVPLDSTLFDTPRPCCPLFFSVAFYAWSMFCPWCNANVMPFMAAFMSISVSTWWFKCTATVFYHVYLQRIFLK